MFTSNKYIDENVDVIHWQWLLSNVSLFFFLSMCCQTNETKSNRVTKITNCSLLFYIFLWNIMNVILLICLRKDLLYSIYDSFHSITNQFDRWEVLILNSCEYCLKNEILYIVLNPLFYSIFYSQSNFYLRSWWIRNRLSLGSVFLICMKN